jgi:hypothetical protein
LEAKNEISNRKTPDDHDKLHPNDEEQQQQQIEKHITRKSSKT